MFLIIKPLINCDKLLARIKIILIGYEKDIPLIMLMGFFKITEVVPVNVSAEENF